MRQQRQKTPTLTNPSRISEPVRRRDPCGSWGLEVVHDLLESFGSDLMKILPTSFAVHSPKGFGRWCGRLGLATVLALSVGSAPAFAGPDQSVASQQLHREVESLRQQLGRVNGEVRVLKQSPRSMSVDYRLRQKLADAEVLGRKLTEKEAQMRASEPGSERAPSVGPSPTAHSTDGPVELNAKADILLDQAQKLSMQADRIDARIERDRVRTTLRARARRLEQDPFAALEGPKRSLVFSRSEARAVVKNDPSPKEDNAIAPATSLSDGRSSSPMPASPMASPPAPGVVPTFGGAPESSASPSGGSPTPGPARLGDAPSDAGSGGTSTSVSLSYRSFLDARALAEIERLQAAGDPNARAKVMTATAASLRKQARVLEGRASTLRRTK